MATLIKLDGTKTEVFPASKEDGFTLDELRQLIGCQWIEHVGPNDKGECLIVDEEGWLKADAQVNVEATKWYQESFGAMSQIAGNAVIAIEGEEFK